MVHLMMGLCDAFPKDLLAALPVGFGVEFLRRRAKSLAYRVLFKDEPVTSDDD